MLLLLGLWIGSLKVPYIAGAQHLKSIYSYVSVPVLSKQIKSTSPPIMTLFGETQ
jgi:hypothetical protein